MCVLKFGLKSIKYYHPQGSALYDLKNSFIQNIENSNGTHNDQEIQEISYKLSLYVPLEFSLFQKLEQKRFFKNRKMLNPDHPLQIKFNMLEKPLKTPLSFLLRTHTLFLLQLTTKVISALLNLSNRLPISPRFFLIALVSIFTTDFKWKFIVFSSSN